MRFSETKAFGELLARVDAHLNEVDREINAQIDELARTIESKKLANASLPKSRHKKYSNLETRISKLRTKLETEKTECEERRKKLLAGTSEEITTYLACKIRAEMRGSEPMTGWIWTPEAEASLALPCKRHEGPAEKAVAIQMGEQPKTSQAKRDRDDGDVKYGESSSGNTQPISPGVEGQCAYNGFIIARAEEGFFKREDVDSTLLNAFRRGEVSKKLLESNLLPVEIQAELKEALKPSTVLGAYGNIYLAFSFGYNLIPVEDADEAWTLLSITKCKPRYVIDRGYVIRKMLEESQSLAPIEPTRIDVVQPLELVA